MFSQKDLQAMERDIWKIVAYLTRYGRQRIQDILDMPMHTLRLYSEELTELVKQENQLTTDDNRG